MWVWPGLKLLGGAGSRKIQNGVTYQITSITEDTITLGEIKLTYPNVAASLRLAYAQTYASCQGSEFDGTLALWDTDNRHFTMRHLFVALSRAKRAEDVCVN
jgi:ATP-dependent exoDNAse (exonuclease V) alpha subunit